MARKKPITEANDYAQSNLSDRDAADLFFLNRDGDERDGRLTFTGPDRAKVNCNVIVISPKELRSFARFATRRWQERGRPHRHQSGMALCR